MTSFFTPRFPLPVEDIRDMPLDDVGRFGFRGYVKFDGCPLVSIHKEGFSNGPRNIKVSFYDPQPKYPNKRMHHDGIPTTAELHFDSQGDLREETHLYEKVNEDGHPLQKYTFVYLDGKDHPSSVYFEDLYPKKDSPSAISCKFDSNGNIASMKWYNDEEGQYTPSAHERLAWEANERAKAAVEEKPTFATEKPVKTSARAAYEAAQAKPASVKTGKKVKSDEAR
jgi:hypothetical protein